MCRSYTQITRYGSCLQRGHLGGVNRQRFAMQSEQLKSTVSRFQHARPSPETAGSSEAARPERPVSVGISIGTCAHARFVGEGPWSYDAERQNYTAFTRFEEKNHTTNSTESCRQSHSPDSAVKPSSTVLAAQLKTRPWNCPNQV